MTEKITHLQDMKKLVENTKDKQELEKLYEQTKNRSTWKKEFQSELKTVFGKSAFDKKLFLDNVLKDRTNIALFQMTHRENGYTKDIDGKAGEKSQTKQLAEKKFVELAKNYTKEEIQKSVDIMKNKNKKSITKLKDSDMAEKDFHDKIDKAWDQTKDIAGKTVDVIGNIINPIENIKRIGGILAKTPALFRENENMIKKSANDAAWVAYMGTFGWAIEGGSAVLQKGSNRSQIAMAEIGRSLLDKSVVDDAKIDQIISNLKSKDISITTSDGFIFATNIKTGEKTKIIPPQNKELLASK